MSINKKRNSGRRGPRYGQGEGKTGWDGNQNMQTYGSIGPEVCMLVMQEAAMYYKNRYVLGSQRDSNEKF